MNYLLGAPIVILVAGMLFWWLDARWWRRQATRLANELTKSQALIAQSTTNTERAIASAKEFRDALEASRVNAARLAACVRGYVRDMDEISEKLGEAPLECKEARTVLRLHDELNPPTKT